MARERRGCARTPGGKRRSLQPLGFLTTMLLILALIVALVFLPWPWSVALILVAAVWEASTSVFWIRYTRRRRARVGVETLVGQSASVITPLAPDGQVKVNGEIWQAHSERVVHVSETVVIRAVHGLTLEVEPH
jgi:membrane protein implicated in regulation of membrane protease activity